MKRRAKKSISKRCALVAIRSEHLARFISALCMDMHGSTLVYTYISNHKVCFGLGAPGAGDAKTFVAARVWPGAAARQVPLEPALEPQHARKVPFEPTAVRCISFLRSKWPLEKCCLLFFYYRHNFCSAPPCFVHVMQGVTQVYSIYIYIYICYLLLLCPAYACLQILTQPSRNILDF